MKRILLILLIVNCQFSIFNLASAQSLTLVHTSDTHSCIEPISPHDIKPEQADKGGYIRRVSLLKELRQEHPDLLLLDCGDFSQGSVYYSLFKGEVEVSLMNEMHYDACTIGNHEFDCGMDNMARLFRMAQFPIVCANYDFTGTVCEGLVRPYIIKERAGMRVGIFGLCPQLEGLVSSANCKGVTYHHPTEVAQQVVDKLRNEEGCQFVICLSHLGYGDRDDQDPAVIQATRGIDVVLGGHSHSYFEYTKYLPNADGRMIPLDHQGKNAQFVGVLQFEW
ncbi:MAG: metallophosphatase [Bacteroidaceae bacterium]|nr:metallophosphatase [Bacteroidaceae bacterium]